MQNHISASTASHPRRVSFDVLALWALTITAGLAAVLFVPFANIPFIYSKITVLAFGGLVGLALFILARLSRGNIIMPPMGLVGTFWLVPLAYLLSSLFSGVGFTNGLFGTAMQTDTLGFMGLCAVFATLVALTFRRASQYRTFFKVGLAVLALTLAAQLTILILSATTQSVAATANIVGSFVDLGMLLGLGIIISLLAFRVLPLSPRLTKVLWALMIVGLFVLALVNSQTIWVLVALAALGLFIEGIMRRQGRGDYYDDFDDEHTPTVTENSPPSTFSMSPQAMGAPLLALVVALFFIVGGSTLGSSLAGAFNVSYLDVRPSWPATFEVGGATYASSPFFGSGPSTFVGEWLKYKDQALNETIFWNVDFVSGIGFIPTSFVTTGILGALAWLTLIGFFLWMGVRFLLFRAPEEPFVRFVSIASFVGALYVLAIAVFAIPGPVMLLLGFFLLGLFASSMRYGGARREHGIIFSRNPRVGFLIVFAFTLLLLAAVIAAYVVVERYLADASYQRATTAYAAGDLSTAEGAARNSLIFAPSGRALQLIATAGMVRMNQIASNTELSATEAQQQFQEALSGSVEAAIAATQRYPENYENWVLLGNVYRTVVPLKIEGAYENAAQAYAKAAELNPTSPTVPFLLAQLEIAQGDGAAAEKRLAEAITLKRDYTQAILLLSQLQVELGRPAEALEAAEAAAYFAPNDPLVLFQVGLLRFSNGDAAGAIQALSRAIEANPQYANARFFLAAMHANEGDYDVAIDQLTAVAELSPQNADAVAGYVGALEEGRNPFPESNLRALGIPAPPVQSTQGQ